MATIEEAHPMKVVAERTRDLYEQLPGYPKPEMGAVPPLDSVLEELRVPRWRWFERLYTFAVLRCGGFAAFLRQPPERLEQLMRQTYVRTGGGHAPIISATIALRDDARNPSALDRAAALIMAAVQLHREIRTGTLSPDRQKDRILEMGQYANLFSTSFILDGGRLRLYKPRAHSHVVVLVAGLFYKLQVEGLSGEAGWQRLRTELGAIAELAKHAPRSAKESSPGIFTCCAKHLQVAGLKQMSELDSNAASLAVMRDSLTTVCLDLDAHPATDSDALRLAQSLNPDNRWYYSSVQLVVFGNAKAAMICSFDAYLDGNVMMRCGAELVRRCDQMSLSRQDGFDPVTEPAALAWSVEPTLVRKARESLRTIQDSQAATFTFPGIGRRLFIAHQVDPVGAFLTALAWATKQVTGKLPQIEQLLVMSRFRCMGLGAANVVTPEMESFIHAVEHDGIEPESRTALLKAAAASQQAVVRKSRAALPPMLLYSIFMASSNGVVKLYNTVAMVLVAMLAATRARTIRVLLKDVIISHPEPYSECPLVGRPGVRIPYVNYFTLHYHMLDESITLTLAPSPNWPASNSEFAASIHKNLEAMVDLLGVEATRLENRTGSLVS